MERVEAMVISVIFFIIFGVLSYFGAHLTWWSAMTLATLLFLILLNIFYPPSQVTNDSADYSLGLYIFLEITGIIILLIYLGVATLTDVR